MSQPQVYWCGRFLPRDQATMDVEDRGVLFGDGVYEVVRYYGGRSLAMAAHVARLRGSLAAMALPQMPDIEQLEAISDELVRRNGCPDAKVYWQVTRGPWPRDHVIPRQAQPTLLVMASSSSTLEQVAAATPARAILAPDIRWGRCSAKTLMLLPAVLARTQARDAGADEAILHRHGTVTEGSATNVLIVRDGEVWTHPADDFILHGVTRAITLDLARGLGLPVRERCYHVSELLTADEVLISGTTTHVRAVVSVDGRAVAGGQPGPVARRLLAALVEHIRGQCLSPAV